MNKLWCTTALISVNNIWFAIIFYPYILDIISEEFSFFFVISSFIKIIIFSIQGEFFQKKHQQEGP